MKRSTYRITHMDCSAEEQMIRMKLEPLGQIAKLEFDLRNRTLVVFHTGPVEEITPVLASLNLGSSMQNSEDSTAEDIAVNDTADKKLLWLVFTINAGFFLVEIVAGLIAGSMGLIADSLDMLADAIVYGMSLMVVGAAVSRKKRVAKISGFFQLTLAIFGLIEVVRRFLGYEGTPDYLTMILVSTFALVGNAVSLYLLQKKKSNEAHMQASYIFTSNDVIANIGVILAGVIVYFSNSSVPDLVIGCIVFLLVLRGSFRILNLAR